MKARKPRFDPETTLVAYWDPREPGRQGGGDLMYAFPKRPDGRLLHHWFTLKLDVPRDDRKSLDILEELEARGYDLKTLRFSIRLKEPPRAPHVTAVDACPHGCVGACSLCTAAPVPGTSPGDDRDPNTMDTLGDALPREMARVRDEVLPVYDRLGAPGMFAATMMRRDLDAAARALAEVDVVAMLRVFEALKGWNL